MSADLAVQPVHTARKVPSTTQTVSVTTATQVALGTTDYSRGTAVGTGTANALTANVAGVYRFSAGITTLVATSRTIALILYVNGSAVREISAFQNNSATVNASTFLSDDLVLAAGDSVTLYMRVNTGSPVIQSGSVLTWLTLTYLGP